MQFYWRNCKICSKKIRPQDVKNAIRDILKVNG